MQRGAKDFTRAESRIDLGNLGNPERWGGRTDLSVFLDPRIAGSDTEEDIGEQFIRAQTPDLIARAWELSAEWHLIGVGEFDTVRFDLEVTWGSGQANSKGRIRLNPPPAMAPPAPDPWVVDFYNGVLQLKHPIPACAIAIRARLWAYVEEGGEHRVDAWAAVMIAPRAL